MELRHLEHFLAVAEERHFTRAATRAHVVQSSLSASIRTLERDLGASLFTRSTRHVELTDAGRALVPEARRMIAPPPRRRAVRRHLKRSGPRSAGRWPIGTGKAPTSNLIMILTRFREAHPNIALNLHQGGSLELVEAVRDGRLDLAPLGLPGRELPGVTVTVLATEPMVLACPPHHRLANRQRVRIAELAGEAFVDFDPAWGIGQTGGGGSLEADVPAPRRVHRQRRGHAAEQ